MNIKSIEFKKVLIQLGIAVVLFIILTFLGLKALDIYSKHGESVTVPNLTNLNEVELAELVESNSLRYEIIDSGAYNPNIKPGGVIEQDPEAESEVKEGRKIYITLNPSSPGFVNLPKLKDQNIRRIVSYARATGLNIKRIEFKKDIADFVILDVTLNGKSLKKGDRIAKGSDLEVTVGKTAGKLCSLPYIVKYSKNDAIDKILSHGLNIGSIRYEEGSENVDPKDLVVFKQDPMSARNEIYSAGRGVNLWLKRKEKKKDE